MNLPVRDIGAIGLVKDLAGVELPLGAWTEARNVRFLGPSVTKALGHRTLASIVSIDPVLVTAIFSVVSGDIHLWVLCGTEYIRTFDSATVADINPIATTYTGTIYDRWNGGTFNGVFVLNNGVDAPQMWDLPGGAAVLADLSNWQSGVLAKVVRPFKNYLVALAVTKSGVFDKRLVKWSHPAAPLTVPISWDESDTARDAGEVSLGEGQDALVDCLPLGDDNIVYTEKQTWVMRLAGNNQIFTFRLLFPSSGLLSQNCVVAFAKNEEGPYSHFVVTHDDFKIHDGVSIASIGTDAVRNWFFSRMTSSSHRFVTVVNKEDQKEIWIVFPYSSGSIADTALIWNYRYNTWTVRDMPPTRAVGTAFQAPTSVPVSWNGLVGNWASQTQIWGDFTYVGIKSRMLIYDESQDKIMEVSADYTSFDGSSISTTFERTGLAVKGSSQGQPAVNDDVRAILRRVWPRVYGDAGLVLNVSVGWQETREDEVTWLPFKPFVIGSKRPVDFTMPYRYLSIRVEETSTGFWRMQGFDLEISPMGKF